MVLLNTLRLGKKAQSLSSPSLPIFSRKKELLAIVNHNLGDLYFSKRTVAHSYVSESPVIGDLH